MTVDFGAAASNLVVDSAACVVEYGETVVLGFRALDVAVLLA